MTSEYTMNIHGISVQRVHECHKRMDWNVEMTRRRCTVSNMLNWCYSISMKWKHIYVACIYIVDVHIHIYIYIFIYSHITYQYHIISLSHYIVHTTIILLHITIVIIYSIPLSYCIPLSQLYTFHIMYYISLSDRAPILTLSRSWDPN